VTLYGCTRCGGVFDHLDRNEGGFEGLPFHVDTDKKPCIGRPTKVPDLPNGFGPSNDRPTRCEVCSAEGSMKVDGFWRCGAHSKPDRDVFNAAYLAGVRLGRKFESRELTPELRCAARRYAAP
jgi:DNA-directed RNA polymerase subunit RPC12/RpoP